MKQTTLGDMRHYLTVQAPQDTDDGIGGVTRVYVAFANVWAAIEPLSGTKTWQSQQNGQEISHRITIAYRTDISGDMQLVLGARIFEIRAAFDPDETGRFVNLDWWEFKP